MNIFCIYNMTTLVQLPTGVHNLYIMYSSKNIVKFLYCPEVYGLLMVTSDGICHKTTPVVSCNS